MAAGFYQPVDYREAPRAITPTEAIVVPSKRRKKAGAVTQGFAPSANPQYQDIAQQSLSQLGTVGSNLGNMASGADSPYNRDVVNGLIAEMTRGNAGGLSSQEDAIRQHFANAGLSGSGGQLSAMLNARDSMQQRNAATVNEVNTNAALQNYMARERGNQAASQNAQGAIGSATAFKPIGQEPTISSRVEERPRQPSMGMSAPAFAAQAEPVVPYPTYVSTGQAPAAPGQTPAPAMAQGPIAKSVAQLPPTAASSYALDPKNPADAELIRLRQSQMPSALTQVPAAFKPIQATGIPELLARGMNSRQYNEVLYGKEPDYMRHLTQPLPPEVGREARLKAIFADLDRFRAERESERTERIHAIGNDLDRSYDERQAERRARINAVYEDLKRYSNEGELERQARINAINSELDSFNSQRIGRGDVFDNERKLRQNNQPRLKLYEEDVFKKPKSDPSWDSMRITPPAPQDRKVFNSPLWPKETYLLPKKPLPSGWTVRDTKPKPATPKPTSQQFHYESNKSMKNIKTKQSAKPKPKPKPKPKAR